MLVTLGVLNQKRQLVVPLSDDRHALLTLRMDSLEEANLWQRYRDADQWPNAAAWWKQNAKMMAEADPETRVAHAQGRHRATPSTISPTTPRAPRRSIASRTCAARTRRPAP